MALTYALENEVARITFDDGKVNAVTFEVIENMRSFLDRTRREAGAVVISGRDGCFCAGFDLKAMKDSADSLRLVRAGFELCIDLLEYPLPVVMAATGHAMAMGAFLLLAGDKRVGAEGDFKIGLNETRIGFVLPPAAMILARARLSVTWLPRSLLNAEILSPPQAMTAGFLDSLSEPDRVVSEAVTQARELAGLHAGAFRGTKKQLYAGLIQSLRTSLDQTFVLTAD